MGRIKFTFNIGLQYHSAQVTMNYSASAPARITWRTKIMHDKTLAGDDRIFTYPDVHGCSKGTVSCKVVESRYGDGHNVLPYESKWKVYWEAYGTRLIVDGESYPGGPKAQSDRATCYKTVSCKFK